MKENCRIGHSQRSGASRKKVYEKIAEVLKRQPDLYLILSHKIYPLHRSFLKESLYVANQVGQDGKVVIITSEVDMTLFEKVLDYLYGEQLMFDKDDELQKLLQVAKMLEIEKLDKEIKKRLKDNFEDYNIFYLFQVGLKHGINWLLELCNEELIALQYEQININKYDLFELDQPIFEEIIKNHQRLKGNHTIKGLKNKCIQQIIEEYMEYRGCKVEVEKLMKINHDCFDIQPNEKGQCKTPAKTILTKKSKSQNQGIIKKQDIQLGSCRGIALYGSKDKIKQILEYSAREIRNGNVQIMDMIKNISQQKNTNFFINRAISIEDFSERLMVITSSDSIETNESRSEEKVQNNLKVPAEELLPTVEKKDSTIYQLNAQEMIDIKVQFEMKCSKCEPEQFFLPIPKMEKNITF